MSWDISTHRGRALAGGARAARRLKNKLRTRDDPVGPAAQGRLPIVMAGRVPIGANLAEHEVVVSTVSWPGLARPSTTCGAETEKDVDGRHKAGHDTGVTGPAKS